MKKIGISFFTLITLLIATLTLIPSVFASSESFNVIVHKEGVEPSNHEIPFVLGATVELEASELTGLDEDAYFLHNGELITSSSYSFVLSESTLIRVIVKEQSDEVDLYLDTNGTLLDIQFNPLESGFNGEEPSKPGYHIDGWAEEVVTDTNITIYTPNYVLEEDTEFAVTINDVTDNVLWNTVVTLEPNGEDFAYWVDLGGQVVSTDPNYSFSVLSDINLHEVQEVEYQPQFSVYLSNVTGIRDGYESFLGYINNPNPSNYQIVEYGLILSNEQKVLTLDDVDGESTIKKPSTILAPTNEFLRSVNEDLYTTKRAYVIYKDGGVQKVVYSDNNFIVIPAITGQSFVETFNDLPSTSSSSYNSRDFEGINGQSWIISGARADQTITGKAVTLNNSSLETTFTNGLSELSFKYKKSYSGTGTLKVYLNGDQFGDTISTSDQTNVQSFNLQNINLSGEVELKIVATERMSIDDLTWKTTSTPEIKSKMYSVTFISQNQEVETQSIIAGDVANEIQPEEIPHGYSFEEWISEDGLSFDFNTPITTHIVLNAVFVLNKWNLTFNTNGGSSIEPQLDVEYGSEILQPSDPSKDGYTFAGWYLDEELTEPVEWPYVVPDDDATLYSKWTVNKYTIVTAGDAGSEISDIEADFGSSVEKPDDPQREGYNFVAWYLDEELTEPVEWPIVMPLDGMTIYAKWADASVTYTVSFELHGGNGTLEDVVLSAGEKVTKPTDPTKDGGFAFKGWYTESDYINEFDFEIPITADITLHAKWAALYTVSFNLNGQAGSIADQVIEEGMTVTKPADPTKDGGYEFEYWYHLNSEVPFDFDTLITDDLVLTAKWKTQVYASDLFISMYVEGTGNRKAIQIFNGTGQTVDMSSYNLKVASNGGNWPVSAINLSGSLAHGQVYVVRNGTDGNFPANVTSGSLSHNGDDAIGLFKGSTLIDIFGVQGQDPGSGWSLSVTGNGSDTVDKVVVRNSNIVNPNTTWLRSEWYVALNISTANDSAVSTLLSSFAWSPES